MTDATTHVVPKLRAFRARALSWSRELPLAGKLAVAVGMACVTGVMAQFRVPLVPVPITGQVFAVLVAGVLLGGGWGAASQVFYLALGVAGVPWFQGFGSGVGYLSGTTAGYLLAFAPAALLVGWSVSRFVWARTSAGLACVMVGAVSLIYASGAFYLVIGFGFTWPGAFCAGVLPFILPDAVKVALAASLGAALLPQDLPGRTAGE